MASRRAPVYRAMATANVHYRVNPKDGCVITLGVHPERIKEAKALIVDKNQELYILQSTVMQRNSGFTKIESSNEQEVAEIVKQCEVLENEIRGRCKQVRATEAAVRDGTIAATQEFRQWHTQQLAAASQIRSTMQALDLSGSDSPRQLRG